MAKAKKIVKKVETNKAGKKSAVKKPLAKSETEEKNVWGEKDKQTIAKKVSKVERPKRRVSDEDGDDLPPEDVDEVEAATLDAESLAAEVERTESKANDAAGEEAAAQAPLPVAAEDESADASDADTILPSMEGMSILRETELNDVIQDVKRRSEANGGYITYEELNQILPSTIVDAIQSDKYLKILEALGVQVIREEDVKRYLEAKSAKPTDPKARATEMIEDPIRMYLHQMGQVQLLKREEEVEICAVIEEAETKTRDMFNRFLFAPSMYASLLDKLEGQGERFDRIVTDKFDDNRDAYMELIPQFRKEIKDVDKRLREASAKYLAEIAKKHPSPTAVRGAEKALKNAREALRQCFDDLSYKQKVLETLCAEADERIYLPYRALVSKQAQLLTLRASKKRDHDLKLVREKMARLEALFGMSGEEFVTTFSELRKVLKAGQIDKIMGSIYQNWSSGDFAALLRRLDLPEDKPYGDFSRGMKMKMGLAIALAHKPRLLLLDEATSGLDPVVRDDVTALLLDFTRDEGHSILLSSHIVSDLEKVCDYIAFLHKGKLMLMEEKDVLMSEYGLLQCSLTEAEQIDPAAVIGQRDTPYGCRLIVRRDAVPAGTVLGSVSIEELFIFMVKEEQA